MKNLVGVMQGRLLPKYNGRYQAHPIGYWQDEFEIASRMNLDCIEFILDYNDFEKNPLLNTEGIEEIITLSNKTGVLVKTICADYFMEAPLHSQNEFVAKNSLKILKKLIETAEIIGVSDVVIPCVDQSSLDGVNKLEFFIEKIESIIVNLEDKGINLCLETDLAPRPFADLLASFDTKRITVNYDIGNSASLGYSPIEELNAYGKKITDIHIKDRTRNGKSVILGEGDADFKLFFTKLKELNYKGPFIMQAYRDDEGLQIFSKQFKWVQKYLNKFT